MSFIEIMLIAAGLAMDAFAVSLAAGAAGRSRGRRAAFRLSFHFGLFQALMPVAGWLLGRSFVSLIAAVDHWIAFGLLAFVAARMIRSGLSDGAESAAAGDPSRGASLVMLSVATSIDALAVGLGLAMLRVDIWYPCVVIGVVTAALSLTGLRLGSILGGRVGKRVEILGGCILLGIGAKILVEHLTS